MIQIKQGSLLDAVEPIIAHQVNCFGVAGGLAEKFSRSGRRSKPTTWVLLHGSDGGTGRLCWDLYGYPP